MLRHVYNRNEKPPEKNQAPEPDEPTNSFEKADFEEMLQEAYIEPNPDGSPIDPESLSEAQLEYLILETVIRERIAELVEMSKEVIMTQVRKVVRRFYPDPTFIKISLKAAPSFEEDFMEYSLEIRNELNEPMKSGIGNPIKLILVNYGFTFDDVSLVENTSERWIRFFFRDPVDKMYDFASQFPIEDGSLADIGVKVAPKIVGNANIAAFDDDLSEFDDGYGDYEDEDNWQ